MLATAITAARRTVTGHHVPLLYVWLVSIKWVSKEANNSTAITIGTAAALQLRDKHVPAVLPDLGRMGPRFTNPVRNKFLAPPPAENEKPDENCRNPTFPNGLEFQICFFNRDGFRCFSPRNLLFLAGRKLPRTHVYPWEIKFFFVMICL